MVRNVIPHLGQFNDFRRTNCALLRLPARFLHILTYDPERGAERANPGMVA